MLNYLLGLLAGVATPIQTSVNSKLRERIGSPYLTSIISFAGAIIIVLAVVAIIEGNFDIPFAEIAQKPLWIWLGGACGFFIVFSSVLAMPHLGSAMAVMLLSFGQIMTGLVIDNWGFFDSPQVPFTMSRLIGAVLLIAGVILISYIPSDGGEKKRYPLGYVLIATFGGVNCALQVAINGTLANVVGSGWKCTLVSMIIGTATCITATLIIFALKGKNGIFDNAGKGDFPLKAYMVTGGFFAFVIVASNSITAPILGAGLVTVLNLIAQMSTGLVIDATGFLGIPKQKITARKIIGVLTMVVGTAIIMFL